VADPLEAIRKDMQQKPPQVRIPVNWSTDSGGSGPASESLTQVYGHDEVGGPIQSRKMCLDGGVSIISFPSFRFVVGGAGSLHSGDVVQDSGDVGQRSGGSGPPER